MPNPEHEEQKKIGATMFALMWLGIFLVMGLLFSGVVERQANPNHGAQTLQLAGGTRELVLQRNRQGHYVANGSINQQPVTFMLDTGATDVSIPSAIARKLGIKGGAKAMYNTANGAVEVSMTRLEEISLGDIKLYDVRATINPGYRSNQILLGMSFLKHLEFTQRGNTLTLRQYPDS